MNKMKKSLIKLKDVWKTYQMGEISLDVLKGISLEIYPGEFILIIGPSGSGKSTLMNQVGILDTPSKGNIFLEGKDISKLDESGLAQIRGKKIGFIFQQFNLLPGFTALENVLVAMSFGSAVADKGRAESLLESVGLADRLHHKPAALSIGQQQRVAVARALANRPRVLLADEPTASIDPAHQQQVIDLLQTTCQEEQVALLVVTHAPEVAEQFPIRHRLEDFNQAVAVHPTTNEVC